MPPIRRSCWPTRALKILHFDEGGISACAYEETEHYAITRDFLNHYPRRLQQLLAGDEEA